MAAGQARQATVSRLHVLGLGEEQATTDVLVSGATGPVPPRSVDDEPASLVYDSNLDPHLVATVRGATRPTRQLTFEGGDLILELEVSGTGQLVGQLVPPQAAVVELRHRAGTTSLETDELGCFRVRDMPVGPVSFRCRATIPVVQAVATSWIAL
jgi:hypothetical protein